MPMIQIFGGGAHAGRRVDIQDFLIMPVGASIVRRGRGRCPQKSIRPRDSSWPNEVDFVALQMRAAGGLSFRSPDLGPRGSRHRD